MYTPTELRFGWAGGIFHGFLSSYSMCTFPYARNCMSHCITPPYMHRHHQVFVINFGRGLSKMTGDHEKWGRRSTTSGSKVVLQTDKFQVNEWGERCKSTHMFTHFSAPSEILHARAHDGTVLGFWFMQLRTPRTSLVNIWVS